MVGNRDVLEASLPRRFGHRLHVIAPVRLGRVHVQIAAQIGAIDEARQRTRGRRLDFAARFAKFRWNPVEAQRAVNVGLLFAADACVVGRTKEPVLIEFHPEPDCPIAQHDIVRLRSGEVLERRAPAVCWHEPEIGLKPSCDEYARLRFAPCDDPFDETVPDEVVHQRSIRTRREDVEISAGVASAPQAADRRDVGGRRALAQKGDQRRRRVVRIGQQMSSGVAAPLVERLEDQCFLFCTHPAERAKAAVGGSAL